MTHVLLVDDLAIVRFGTTHLLKQHFPGIHISTAEDINEMVTHLDETRFDLVILDIDFPGGNNFAILDIIRLRQPGIKILMFSGNDDRIYTQRYLDAGVHGFLSKSESERQFKKAITTILQGTIYVSENLKKPM